jgi:hypothetical protein
MYTESYIEFVIDEAFTTAPKPPGSRDNHTGLRAYTFRDPPPCSSREEPPLYKYHEHIIPAKKQRPDHRLSTAKPENARSRSPCRYNPQWPAITII